MYSGKARRAARDVDLNLCLPVVLFLPCMCVFDRHSEQTYSDAQSKREVPIPTTGCGPR